MSKSKYSAPSTTLFRLLVMLVVFPAAVACSGPAEGVWLDAPGWRQGQLVTQSLIPDAATIALDDEKAIYVFVIDQQAEESVLRVRRLNRQMNEVWQRDLDVRLDRGDQPRIVWDGERLHLLWIDGAALYGTTIDSEGEDVATPQQLSGAASVDSYDVAVDGEGRVTVLYGGTAQNPGVFVLEGLGGATSAGPRAVDDEGYEPQLRVDGAGDLHATWLRYPPGTSEATIYYMYDGEGAFENGTPLTTFTVSFTAGLQGPYLGLDNGPRGGHAYVFWSVLERTGLSAGSATTSFVSFPLGQPHAVSERQVLYVPADLDLQYDAEPTGSTLQAGPRVTLSGSGSRAAPLDLWPNQEPAPELVVAARASVAYELRKQASQSALIFFQDGQPRAYQLLSFSRTNTVAPYVLSDDQGHLYATWMEPGGQSGFLAYAGSTAPDVYAALTKVTSADVGRLLAETVFGMLAGAALSPFAGILWLVAPLIVLGITSFLRRDDGRTISRGALISLGLALLTFWVVKAATLPGFWDYVPFSSWIPFIPGWLGGPLRWGVMIIIAALALWTAWRFTYKRQAHSVLNFMLIYAAVDSVLSMAIYGSIIYGFI